MSRSIVRIAAVIATVGFAACESTVSVGDLTEIEAQELAAVVMFATFNSTGDVPATAPGMSGPAGVPFSYASEFEGSVACPLGGTVGVAASFEVNGDTESEAGSIEYAMTQVHDACMAAGENDLVFTLWGNPDLSVAVTAENNGQGVVEWGGSIQGGVDWAVGDRTGTCLISLEFSGRDEAVAAVDAQMSGTVCGFSITHSMTVDRS